MAFWRELAAIVARESAFYTGQRVYRRSGNTVKGSANEALTTAANGMSEREALALLVEIVTVGIRGGHRINENIARMRKAMGLDSGAKQGRNRQVGKGSASARTVSNPARQEVAN